LWVHRNVAGKFNVRPIAGHEPHLESHNLQNWYNHTTLVDSSKNLNYREKYLHVVLPLFTA